MLFLEIETINIFIILYQYYISILKTEIIFLKQFEAI